MSSHVYFNFRLGRSWWDKYTGLPDSQHSCMLPVFGQWAVTISPFFNLTSTIKRLYLLIKVPDMSFGQSKPFDFVEIADGFITSFNQSFENGGCLRFRGLTSGSPHSDKPVLQPRLSLLIAAASLQSD